MEAHGVLDAKDAVRAIERMLDEAFQVRGARMRSERSWPSSIGWTGPDVPLPP
jgi:hypothetical protein